MASAANLKKKIAKYFAKNNIVYAAPTGIRIDFKFTFMRDV